MKIEKPQSDWQNMSEGTQQVVCCDVIDHGVQMRTFQGENKGLAPKIQFVFQGAEVGENGERLTVRGFPQFVLWSNNARFYGFLCGWLGQKKVGEIMASGEFDPESLIGVNAQVVIEHNESEKDGVKRTYANIANIMPWNAKFGPDLEIVGYDRVCDREGWVPPNVPALTPTAQPANGGPRPASTNAQPAATPMTAATSRKIYGKAVQIVGDQNADDRLNHLAASLKKDARGFDDLSEDEAWQVHALLVKTDGMEASKAMLNRKKEPAPVAAGFTDDPDDDSMFDQPEE